MCFFVDGSLCLRSRPIRLQFLFEQNNNRFRTLETPPLSANQISVSNLWVQTYIHKTFFFQKLNTYQPLSQNRFMISQNGLRQKLLPNLFYYTAQEFLKSDQVQCLNFWISCRPNTQILCFVCIRWPFWRSRPIRIEFLFYARDLRIL